MGRRKAESFPELLFYALKKVPWWVGPLVIVPVFVVLRFAIPALTDSSLEFDSSTIEKGVGYSKQIVGSAIAKMLGTRPRGRQWRSR